MENENENENEFNEFSRDTFLKVGMSVSLELYNLEENICAFTPNHVKELNENYIKKLETQLSSIAEEITEIDLEISKLDKKNKNNNKIDFTTNKIFSIKDLFTFNLNEPKLDKEKENFNILTINKLRERRDFLFEIYKKTKQYKINALARVF